jgi:hypothetical protein
MTPKTTTVTGYSTTPVQAHSRTPALVKRAAELSLTLIGAVPLAWLTLTFITATAATRARIKTATWIRRTFTHRL